MRKLVLIAVLAGITARGNSKPQQTSDDQFLCLLTGMCSVDTTGLPKPVSITSEISTTPRPIGGDPFLCSLVTSSQQCSEPEIANKCKIKCSVGEDPFLCSLVTSTEQCSEPEIARQCRFFCSGVSNPCSCVYFDECCDTESSDPNHPALIDERIRNAQDGNCPGLTLCCKTKCKREERPSIINNNPSTLPARPLTQPPVISKPVIPVSQAATTLRPDVIPTEDECGISTRNRYTSAIKVTPREWPSLAVLKHRFTNGSCYGTLITKQHVISTVSCFRTVSRNDKRVKPWLVRLGAFSTANYVYEAQDFSIMDLRIRDYNYKTQENDIIIVKLDKPLHSFTDSIRAACLPYHLRNNALEGSRLMVVGSILGGIDETIFGNNAQYENGKLPILQINVPVLPVRECQDKYQRIIGKASTKKVDETQLCAGPYSINQCLVYGSNLYYFDSDARNTQRNYVVGLVSFGPSVCGANSEPDVYSRIGYHLDWIEESIRQLSLSTTPQDDPFGESTAIDGCSSDSDCVGNGFEACCPDHCVWYCRR